MKKNNLSSLSQEVKYARKKAKLTQEDLALFAGVSRKFISELENEKQTLEIGKVLDVLNALGISLTIYNRLRDM